MAKHSTAKPKPSKHKSRSRKADRTKPPARRPTPQQPKFSKRNTKLHRIKPRQAHRRSVRFLPIEAFDQTIALLQDANLKLDYIIKNLPRFNHIHNHTNHDHSIHTCI